MRHEIDRSIALDHVVAHLTEDRVVGRSAGEIVVAVRTLRRQREAVTMIEQGDQVIPPGPMPARIGLRHAVRLIHTSLA